MRKYSADRIIVCLMLFTFELPLSLAFTHSYFPEEYKALCFIGVILYSAIVSFVGFLIPELYSKLFHYKKPEFDPCIDTFDYIKKRRLWMTRIAGVLFAIAGFLLSYFIKTWYISLIEHSVERNAVGFSYELRMLFWSYAVIYFEGAVWFIPDDIFMPDEANWLYFALPTVAMILIPMLYFALNIKICAIILVVYYVLLYIRGFRRNRIASKKTDEEIKIENSRMEK